MYCDLLDYWLMLISLLGMERLQKSMTIYVKSLSKRSEAEDREKILPVNYLGSTMVAHGDDFEPDSEFGQCLSGKFMSLHLVRPLTKLQALEGRTRELHVCRNHTLRTLRPAGWNRWSVLWHR